MGCDIHLHTEIKVDGKWHHYSQPRVQRDYVLFFKLAGVRGPFDGVNPIAEPRGVPNDLSFTTKFDVDYMGDDGHSHSWLTGDELAEVVRWNDERRVSETGQWFSTEHSFLGYLFGNGWGRDSEHPKSIEDVRAVFWFDN